MSKHYSLSVFFLLVPFLLVQAQLKVNSNGRVGIGTTNPYTELHTIGNSTFSQSTSSITSAAFIRGLNSYSSATTPDYTWFNNDQTGMFHPGWGNLAFTINGYERLRLNSSGKFGIGTTSPYLGIFDIRGNGLDNGIALYDESNASLKLALDNGYAYLIRGGSTNLGIKIASNGHIGINGYASSNYWLYVTGDCRADSWSTYSDSTAKTDIQNIINSNKLLELNPVTFKWKERPSEFIILDERNSEEMVNENNIKESDISESSTFPTVKIQIPEPVDERVHYGFLAQEVQELYPDIVTSDEEGRLAIEYDAFIPLLVDVYKNLVLKLDTLENIISIQNDEINDLRTKINGETEKKSANETIKEETPALFQNIPNPFNVNTEIKYFLPENTTSASINIYDLNGRPVKKIDINETGMSKITIHGAELKPGMYLYALIADGIEVDTKRMILTN